MCVFVNVCVCLYIHKHSTRSEEHWRIQILMQIFKAQNYQSLNIQLNICLCPWHIVIFYEIIWLDFHVSYMLHVLYNWHHLTVCTLKIVNFQDRGFVPDKME